jgi:pyridoxamine 5'-phosphate oxidase
MSIADLRKDYTLASLTEADVAADPIEQFSRWFDQALQAQVVEPNAMSLATVGVEGKPSSRIVLLKDFDHGGFTWFTGYDSRKGRELALNPHAALLFHWGDLERQVHIEGRVERVPPSESDAYFVIRPLKSRIGVHASDQSKPVENRGVLEARFTEAAAQYGEHPPRPERWGGFRLIPERLEFWQGRRSRLHDRIAYTLNTEGAWQIGRLQP